MQGARRWGQGFNLLSCLLPNLLPLCKLQPGGASGPLPWAQAELRTALHVPAAPPATLCGDRQSQSRGDGELPEGHR